MLACKKFVRNFLYIFTQIAEQFCVVIINQGGGVAAPVAGQILGEVLPYLEVYKAEQEESEIVEMPDVEKLTLKEAKELLDGFEIEIQGEVNNDSVISKQIPSAGIKTEKSEKIILYVN